MLKFDRQGLIPAVIQDDATGEVLMVAFMNEEAFERTRQTGQAHFFSRSRNAIWHKGERSGNVQEVRAIFVNCEENSLLIRVLQHGDAACHMGYRSCYYRRLLPDDSYEIVAERVFDPQTVYGNGGASEKKDVGARSPFIEPLETALRQLYNFYLYLKDHDLSEESNTSRLLQERSLTYLLARLADELEELAEVQSGEHVHTGRQPDTILEGSQVQYWLLLVATTLNLPYDDFSPHLALIKGYNAGAIRGDTGSEIEQQQNCLDLLASNEHSLIVQGMELGFALVGNACAQAGVSPLEPAEYDLEQMRRKGLIG
ncbi:MAG TPA: phosphoribosyl-AMP cyclohydrolase [Ktedonobacteraceae bacterium]|jgi:phosphoribosyl-AMP cyclohydrolase|nr:phosphoribosyl-AMP cyclohydrolase [Ktedonobacteraceae bacterium]